jgi:2-amino-4-hydroxy-6-hydroxymethyldihydropteridine diphosphokinase
MSEQKCGSCYLGLGSNLGERAANLAEAIRRIENLGLRVARVSSIYETEPVGYQDQPWFLNQVVEITLPSNCEADASRFADPSELLKALLGIERQMGRERTIAGGPRVIDIDLLICGDRVALPRSAPDDDKPPKAADPGAGASLPLARPGAEKPTSLRETDDGTNLILPHPRLHQRRFVMEPLCEIAPNLVHPLLGKTCAELLSELEDDSSVRLYPG